MHVYIVLRQLNHQLTLVMVTPNTHHNNTCLHVHSHYNLVAVPQGFSRLWISGEVQTVQLYHELEVSKVELATRSFL